MSRYETKRNTEKRSKLKFIRSQFEILDAKSAARDVISDLPARLAQYEQCLAAEQARGITRDNMKRVKRLEDLIENTKRSIRMYNGR